MSSATSAWRRFRLCVATAIIGVSLAACGSRTLRVAASGDYPPFSSTTAYGAIVGFDATVAAQFAQDSGREMYFVRLRWPRLIEEAQSQSFDVAMSGVTVRADRIPYLAFSRPYAVTGAIVVVQRGRAEELGTLAQIDRPGVRLAVNRGGHLERVARTHFDKASILTVDDNRMLSDLVLSGEVDAAVSEPFEVRTWPADTFAVIGPFTRDRKAYAVIPAQIDLLESLNTWLTRREQDGWLNDARRQWFGEAAVWTPEEACFEAIAAAIDLRMQLMPSVAAAKRRLNLPIEDLTQENAVLAQAAEWATAAGLNPQAAIALFAKLIEAAKQVQRSNAAADVVAEVDLDSLRGAISLYSRRIIEEAATCRSALQQTKLRPALEASLRGGDDAPMQNLLPAAEMATLLADLGTAPKEEAATTEIVEDIEPENPTNSFIEFCVPPNVKFDRQGYSAEPLVNGEPVAAVWIAAAAHSFRSGRTRVPVAAGEHEYRIYVNGSSGDPHAGGGTPAEPTRVKIDVPEDSVVAIRYTPIIRGSGQFELRWVESPGAQRGGFQPYSGLTRFDAEVEVYEPSDPAEPSRCVW